MTKEEKDRAAILLHNNFCRQYDYVAQIEPRLADYFLDIQNQPQYHNAYEILGAVKFLRMLRTYETDIDTFRDVVYKYEGIWEQRDGVWRHIEGGLKHPGTTGPMYYRLQPFQVFVLASMFLLKVWINTEQEAGTRELLPTEEVRDGYIWDLRRLCTEFTLYTPRKTAKTQLSAFIQFWYFMSGDENAECFCCANASDQAKILFSRSRELIHQMDPREKRIRFTASQVNWKPGQFRTASLTALSAGGKTKDGLFAQLCSADEYGSAAYVNGASDMGKLVSVVESSMGPRREPMTFISTTAGIIQAGPFIDKLQGIKLLLEKEFDPDAEHTISEDRQACLLLEPDEWEQQDEELLLTSKDVRRKVNPMLGIIVQNSFYDDEITKARQNPEKMNEVITKLLNVYKAATVQEWINPEQVRELQIERRIDDCTMERGWNVYAAFDFSHGDDFDAVSFLAYNVKTNEYLADCDAWVNRQAFNKSPYRELYERWERDGWLHVSGDTVVAPEAPITRIMELDKKGINFMAFGYDAKQSKEPILLLKEWLFNEVGVTNPNVMVVPVSQVFSNYNASVQKLDYCFGGVVNMKFSMSPLWPFEFGNCVLEEDLRYGNKKPLKRTANAKVDNVQCLCSCFNLEESIEQMSNV
jgi:phage terminase large subunit-like protein